MAMHHPGVGMVNALINDFANIDLNRKAPGCERSNTMPNLLTNVTLPLIPGPEEESEVPPTDANEDGESSEQIENGREQNGLEEEGKEVNEKVNNPTNEKKYMAFRAMYNSKLGPNPRVPTSEWSGCGFSKTYTNLFPNNDASGNEGGWNGDANDQGNNDKGHSSKSGVVKSHLPLGHQQSNLLDFAASRPNPDNPPTDLPSLFIQNGLEKYIETFISEEIDLDSFAALTEGDLRTLGVSAYPARKRMLVLITQLACPHPDQDWR